MDCIGYLMKKFGLDQKQAVDLMTEVKRERAAVERKFGGQGLVNIRTAELYKRLAGKTDRAALEAAAHKRALTLQYARRLEAFDMITQQFKGMEEEGLSALLVGTNRVKEGARLSADAMQTQLRGYYLGSLIADVQGLGKTHLEMLKKGVLDREIARALWSIDNQEATPYAGPKEAMDIANVIHKWQEKAREDANLAGAWIDKMPGYIVRQSHDQARISKAGFEQWRKDMESLLDWDKTGDGLLNTDQQRKDFLDEVYKNLVLARIPDRGMNPLTQRFGNSRIGSAANKASQQRVLHFRDSDAWFDYNVKYGRSNVREAVIDGLSRMAQNTALMRRLGPSPSAQVDALYGMLERAMRNAGDEDGITRLHKRYNRIRNQLKEVDGSLNSDANPTIAAVGRNVRSLQNMAKLGGAVISGFSDAPVFSSEMAYQGQGFFRSLFKGMMDLLHGRGTEEQQQILSQLGVFYENMCGDIVARVSGDEAPGAMARAQQMFFKLNGLTWWTDSWRRVAGLMMSHELGQNKGSAWNGLGERLRRVLGQYGIGEGEWDVYRQGRLRAADGRDYLTPEAVQDVGDGVIYDYLVKRGTAPKDVSGIAMQTAREELADKLRSYFRDRISYAVLEPDAATRNWMHWGTSAGTGIGEAVRFATQFKSFPAAFSLRVIGRELYGRQGDGAMSTAVSLARLILMTALFGYGSMTVKDLLKGKTPRDPFKKATMIAAFVQGGGLGIYGDFLFGEYNRFGNSLAASLAGRAAGTLSDLANIYARVRDGDSFAQASLRFLLNNVPGNGLFYIRGPFDYLIGHQLFEMMNPGYFRRMQRRVERENGQSFYMKPVGVP